MSDNNFYYETLRETQGELTDEVLSGRLAEINLVLGQLTTSPAWNILLHDAKQLIKQLDDSWQDLPNNDPKLQEMRILKMASKHIFDLPMKYAQELDQIQKELTKRNRPEEIISKDTDNN